MFIQMCKRSGDGKPGGEDREWHEEAVMVVEWVVPHSRVVDKNWEGYLGSK